MTDLITILDSFVFSAIGSNIASEFIKAAWEKINQKTSENLYLEAYKKGLDEIRPIINRYADGEIGIDLEIIQ
jgi:hypothetical protein